MHQNDDTTDAATGLLEGLVKSRGIERILITNSAMRSIGGSQVVCLDIGTVFRRLGAEVWVASSTFADPMRELCREAGLTEIDLLRGNAHLGMPKAFDLIFGLHWPVVTDCLLRLDMGFRHLLLLSLSPYMPIETPIAFLGAADGLIVNSQETARKHACLVQRVAGAPQPVILPNSLPREWFDAPPPPPRNLGRVLCISYHGAERVAALKRGLVKKGIQLTEIGHQTDHRLVTPDIIDHHDAVLSIGHSVPKAMARRRPVFIYDRFGGPGWLTADIYNHNKYYNFSGRGCISLSRKEAITEFTNNFSTATKSAGLLWHKCVQGHSLEQNLASIIKDIKPKSKIKRLYEKDYLFEDQAAKTFFMANGRRAIPEMKWMSSLNPFQIRVSLVSSDDSLATKFWIDPGVFEQRYDGLAGEADLIITGGLLWSAPMDIAIICASDEGEESAADLGLPSPGLAKMYPERAEAATSRFKVVVAATNRLSVFELMVRLPTGETHMLARLRAEPVPDDD